MSPTRWGAAIAALLHERGWTQKQLATAAHLRPNTLTSIIRHGGETDTRTLRRIAQVLDVDIAELMMSAEQRLILRTHRERVITGITASVIEQLEQTTRDLVRRQLAEAGLLKEPIDPPRPPVRREAPLPAPEPARSIAPGPERTDVRRPR